MRDPALNVGTQAIGNSSDSAHAPIDQVLATSGCVVLPPLPQPTTRSRSQLNEADEDMWGFDRPPLDWPEPLIPQSLKRTKSFITIATTIAGVGQLQLGSTSSTSTMMYMQQQQQLMAAQQQQQQRLMSSTGMRRLRQGDDQPPLTPEEYPEIDYLQLTLQASTRIYDIAIESPLTYARNLSSRLGRNNKIYFKREDLQPTCFSFKVRGAYNRISRLSREERQRGVICMSAGNHAQGVAMAARHLGIRATIVMPVSAPEIKVASVRRLGATVVLSGVDLEEAKKECMRISDTTGAVFIPPFDDPYIIAGQATCGMEILRQMKRERVDAIFVPVGGAGLLAGIAAFVKRVRPDVKIVGVNTVDSDGMTKSLLQGKRVELNSVGLFSDGTAVRAVGQETYRICHNLVDDMVLVTVDEICAAIKDVFTETRSIVEPAGALAVAGVKRFLHERGQDISNGVFAVVLTGANMNFDRLRFVCERSRIGEGSECLLSCKIPEQFGSFHELYSIIHPRSVFEISYRYSDPNEAHFYLAVEPTDISVLIEKINARDGMTAVDVTQDDLAKSHLRFLAGGRAPKGSLNNEKLLRFAFGERPGALKGFLEGLAKAKWNLTMMHYRNNGGDRARILVGLEIPPSDEQDGSLQKFLKDFNYEFVDETKNTMYQHFLR